MPCRFGGMSRLHNEFPGFVQKNLPRPGKLYMPLVTHKQFHAQLIFKLTDLPAKWGLRDV